MKPWEKKANEVIQTMCRESWYKANHGKNGKRFKKHRPYIIPLDAVLLINALERGDELTAKIIFQRHAFGCVFL